MAFSLNRIMLIGNLGRDQETRFTTSNVSVTSFSIATTHGYKDKEGNWKNETTWHNIVAFSLSDYFKDGLKKGAKVYIEGRLTKREYDGKDGSKKLAVDVVSEKIILLSEKAEGSGSSSERTEQTENNDAAVGNSAVQDNEDLPF